MKEQHWFWRFLEWLRSFLSFDSKVAFESSDEYFEEELTELTKGTYVPKVYSPDENGEDE